MGSGHQGICELPDDEIRFIYQLAYSSPIIHVNEDSACIGMSHDQVLRFLEGIAR